MDIKFLLLVLLAGLACRSLTDARKLEMDKATAVYADKKFWSHFPLYGGGLGHSHGPGPRAGLGGGVGLGGSFGFGGGAGRLGGSIGGGFGGGIVGGDGKDASVSGGGAAGDGLP